jgi:cytochrome c peroxidase
MHDGSVGTMEAVIDYYDHGGQCQYQPRLRNPPLRLTLEEKHELAAFLKALSGDLMRGSLSKETLINSSKENFNE